VTTETIEAPEQTALATAAAQAIDITTVNLTDLALAKFGPWREQAAKAKTEFAALVLDLQTQSAIDDAISLRNRKIRLPLAEARKTAEALKSKLAAVSKAVGAELPLIEAAWTDAASAITPRIEAAQKVLDDAKEAARLKEEARKDAHREAIAKIRRYLTAAQAPGMTAARIQTGMGMLFDASTGPEFEEFQAEATQAKNETLEAMRVLWDQAEARETEARRLELQRQENERQAAELAKARAELEAQAAAVRAQAAELDRQRREAEHAKAVEDQRKAEEAAEAQRQEALRAEAAAMIERAQAQGDAVRVETVKAVTPEAFMALDAGTLDATPMTAGTMQAQNMTVTAEPAMTHEAFVALVMEAFASKTPTQPKMPVSWWAKVRAAGEALQGVTA
jgi:myosin heavy subunit